MINIKEYNADVAGTSGAFVLPIDHRILAKSYSFHYDGSDWCIHISIDTYIDNTYADKVDNTGLGDTVQHVFGSELPTTSPASMVDTAMQIALDAEYGSGNHTTI